MMWVSIYLLVGWRFIEDLHAIEPASGIVDMVAEELPDLGAREQRAAAYVILVLNWLTWPILLLTLLVTGDD